MLSPTSAATPPPATEFDPDAAAYPVPSGSQHPGVSTYDWLAAMAMQGLVTRGTEVRADRAMTEDEKDREMARRAYKLAAAMLWARMQSPPPIEQIESLTDGQDETEVTEEIEYPADYQTL